ncbi:hypothetical protein T07_9775 [Trichinella nelsoni]|uniref:Uncharacterized protein n=1 Tax=Trichinella nelsoni TaxID=6336 RepID=A0A0V0RTU7_9BILA|nr:hypothetical protein T07_9775 [Trichinella nelsoni]
MKVLAAHERPIYTPWLLTRKYFRNTCSSLSKNPRGNKALLLVRKQRLRNASCTPCFSQWKTME